MMIVAPGPESTPAADLNRERGGTYDARLYGLIHRGNSGDLEFYRRNCDGAQRILELGCGDGRVLRALRARGRELVGVDQHPGLLALAAASLTGSASDELVRLILGDMRAISELGSFERVLIPYCGLLCLLTREAQLDCLRGARQCLGEGGNGAKLIFDMYSAEELHAAWLGGDGASEDDGDVVDERDWVAVVYDGALGYEVYETSDWQPARQRLDVTYHYEAFAAVSRLRLPEEDRVGVIHQRYLLVSEIAALLAEAGFAPPTLFGGFGGESLTSEAEHIVVLAEAVDSHVC